MKSRINYTPTRCVECGAPHAGCAQCANCGSVAEPRGAVTEEWSAEKMSRTAKIYTGVCIAWALLFPFLLPIILKVSYVYR